MKKINLYLNNYFLGFLTQDNNTYIFYANKDDISKAYKDYSLIMKLFNLNNNGIKKYDKIPKIFTQFLQGANRSDLIEKAKIDILDNDFEKLYKLASLNLNPINFKISIK